MMEMWDGYLPPPHKAKNPDKPAKERKIPAGGQHMPGERHGSDGTVAEEELAPLDLKVEIERLNAYRQKLDSTINGRFAGSDNLGLLVQAYSGALEQEVALRDRLENPRPAKKSKITVGKMRTLK